ncbi:MAG: DUF167 domain-containing protein [Candidatus Omnitrophota bacterium]
MRISVKVKPNSKRERVEKLTEREFIVYVNAPAQEGRANAAVIEVLCEYFDIAKTRISIIRGHRGRNKVVDIV